MRIKWGNSSTIICVDFRRSIEPIEVDILRSEAPPRVTPHAGNRFYEGNIQAEHVNSYGESLLEMNEVAKRSLVTRPFIVGD